MNTTFVTAIYSNLSNISKSRWERYTYSLKSIVKCGANFVLYTSPEEYQDVVKFVKDNDIDSSKLKIIQHEISDNIWNKKFNELKTNGADGCGRSMDLVHSKIYWLNKISKQNPFGDSEYFYWIDAGLSFEGLFPNRFLRTDTHRTFEKYTDYNVFNPDWLKRLNEKSKDRCYFMAMTTKVVLWAQPIKQDFYINKNDYMKYHVIGGLFGGKVDFDGIELQYSQILNKLLSDFKNERCLPVEELILNPIVANNKDKIYLDIFDTWYHEDHESSFDKMKVGKSFHELFL